MVNCFIGIIGVPPRSFNQSTRPTGYVVDFFLLPPSPNPPKGVAGNRVKVVQKLATFCKFLQMVGGDRVTIGRTFEVVFSLKI